MSRVLVVDDERSIRLTLTRFLKDAGHEVATAEDADSARQVLAGGDFDVVMSDIVLPRVTGVELLHLVRRSAPDVQVILMTGQPTVDTASEAVRAGAFDYLHKPITKEAAVKAVAAAARVKTLSDEKTRLEEENRRHRDELERLVEERTRELREREDQLRQAQKMEAIGRLAGGVAHDFNNMLTVIRGSAEFLREDKVVAGRAKEDIDDIVEASDRAAGLTRQLLVLSRKQDLVVRPEDVCGIVTGVTKMLGRLLGEDVELVVRTTDEPCVANVDVGQIEQVIVNLAVNARDAMPKGGRLLIELDSLRLTAADIARYADAAEMTPGPHVALAVTDTGSGMDRETQSRLFEPFFTTKEVGKGTGLGLATVYGITKQHRGHISVYSEVGEGTSFRVYLPMEASPADEDGAGEEAAVPRGRETILFVEDDAAVSRVGTRILQGLGYTVLRASCGEEALALVEEHGSAVDLVLTDLIMPGMSGDELVTELRAARPDVKVVYASGYPADYIRRRVPQDGDVPTLRKPFTRSELAEAVRTALDR